jgi:hypothetical protein
MHVKIPWISKAQLLKSSQIPKFAYQNMRLIASESRARRSSLEVVGSWLTMHVKICEPLYLNFDVPRLFS